MKKKLNIPDPVGICTVIDKHYYVRFTFNVSMSDADYAKHLYTDLGKQHRGKDFYAYIVYDKRTNAFVKDFTFVNCFGKKYIYPISLHPVLSKAMKDMANKYIKTYIK